jgi:hypothetical protein
MHLGHRAVEQLAVKPQPQPCLVKADAAFEVIDVDVDQQLHACLLSVLRRAPPEPLLTAPDDW